MTINKKIHATVSKSTFAHVCSGRHTYKQWSQKLSSMHSSTLEYVPLIENDKKKTLSITSAYTRWESRDKPIAAKKLALTALEEELEKKTLEQYVERWKEEHDLDTDILYNTWKRLKQQCSRVPLGDITNKSDLFPIVSSFFVLPSVAGILPFYVPPFLSCLFVPPGILWLHYQRCV